MPSPFGEADELVVCPGCFVQMRLCSKGAELNSYAWYQCRRLVSVKPIFTQACVTAADFRFLIYDSRHWNQIDVDRRRWQTAPVDCVEILRPQVRRLSFSSERLPAGTLANAVRQTPDIRRCSRLSPNSTTPTFPKLPKTLKSVQKPYTRHFVYPIRPMTAVIG